MPTTRRLAAILAADVVGYSRLIGTDEQGTLERLRTIRAELIDAKVAEHKGRIVKTTGDGLLAEFGSSVDAVRCATEVQAQMAERNAMIAPEERIEYRIGIHQGDIVVENGDILVMASTSPRASKAWPRWAGSAYRLGCRRMSPASSTSPSEIWGSRA